MIKVKYEQNYSDRKTCFNCKRRMPIILHWEIDDNQIQLCEDCSSALGRLHYVAMSQTCDCMYDEDQIWKTV